jgi:BirA family biotin operon repressor/biotin-[acetyl-CoA-carboxylase] ligase
VIDGSIVVQNAEFELDRVLRDTFVRHVDFQQTLESTNDRGLKLASDAKTRCPLLVIAEQQTVGRGRGGNRWWSAAGALTFSLVVDAQRFRLTPLRRPKISLTAGLAVCESFEELLPGVHVGLKWPNDVLLDGRKVCGSLIEAPATEPDRLVIGIGINVNNSLASAPEPVRQVATSLRDVANRTFNRTEVLVAVLSQLEQGLERLHRSPDELVKRWQQYCLLRGRTVSLAVNERHVVGNCQGIDGDGALVLKTGNGTKRYFSGVVTGIG